MSERLTCEDVRELLSSYIDNMLDEDRIQAVSDHLKQCDACRKEYDGLFRMIRLLQELPELELPDAFDKNLRAALACEPLSNANSAEDNIVSFKSPKSLGWKKLSSVAAIFVIGIFTLIMYNNSGDLINSSELESEEANMLDSVVTQEDNSFESSDVFTSRKYASAAGIEDSEESMLAYNFTIDDSSDDADNAHNADIVDTADTADNGANDNSIVAGTGGEGDASRSKESENNKSMTTPGGTNLRTVFTEQPEIIDQTIELADTLSQYLMMLDDEMAEAEYEIVDSVQMEEDLWSFQVKVTIIDDEGKETIQDRTYIGQDGTLIWKKD